jgi:hypothetical protein
VAAAGEREEGKGRLGWAPATTIVASQTERWVQEMLRAVRKKRRTFHRLALF